MKGNSTPLRLWQETFQELLRPKEDDNLHLEVITKIGVAVQEVTMSQGTRDKGRVTLSHRIIPRVTIVQITYIAISVIIIEGRIRGRVHPGTNLLITGKKLVQSIKLV